MPSVSSSVLSDIRINHPDDGHWLARRAGCFYDDRSDSVIARPGKGGMLYSGFTGTAIFCHYAGDDAWMTRDLIWVGFHYPFVQLGCTRIFGFISSLNSRAMKVSKKLGFIEEARLVGAVPRGDLVVVSMRREDCRWLKLTPRQLAVPLHRT